MTPDQVGLLAAGIVLVIGLVSVAMWRVEHLRTMRARAARLARRSPVDTPVDDLEDFRQLLAKSSLGAARDEDAVERVDCPGCGRNAGHDKDCTRVQLRRAAKAIDIPREGETS